LGKTAPDISKRNKLPAWRKVMVREESPSKCCVFRQKFCSAAIALKSIGAVAAAASTSPKGEQKIYNNIFQARQIQHLHIEFRNESQMLLLLVT
jgi:hypothetical protein